MAEYTREYRADGFPNSVMDLHDYSDPTVEIAALIHQYRIYQSNQQFSEAADYLELHPELQQYIINANVLNTLDEETRNIEVFLDKYMRQGQIIFYNENEPDFPNLNDVWISSENEED